MRYESVVKYYTGYVYYSFEYSAKTLFGRVNPSRSKIMKVLMLTFMVPK